MNTYCCNRRFPLAFNRAVTFNANNVPLRINHEYIAGEMNHYYDVCEWYFAGTGEKHAEILFNLMPCGFALERAKNEAIKLFGHDGKLLYFMNYNKVRASNVAFANLLCAANAFFDF